MQACATLKKKLEYKNKDIEKEAQKKKEKEALIAKLKKNNAVAQFNQSWKRSTKERHRKCTRSRKKNVL